MQIVLGENKNMGLIPFYFIIRTIMVVHKKIKSTLNGRDIKFISIKLYGFLKNVHIFDKLLQNLCFKWLHKKM